MHDCAHPAEYRVVEEPEPEVGYRGGVYCDYCRTDLTNG